MFNDRQPTLCWMFSNSMTLVEPLDEEVMYRKLTKQPFVKTRRNFHGCWNSQKPAVQVQTGQRLPLQTSYNICLSVCPGKLTTATLTTIFLRDSVFPVSMRTWWRHVGPPTHGEGESEGEKEREGLLSALLRCIFNRMESFPELIWKQNVAV